MKRTFSINPNKEENSVVQITSRNSKSNYSRASRGSMMMEQKGSMDFKHKTIYDRSAIQGNSNSRDSYDLHVTQTQKTYSYTFIVDWQL